jgi:diaminopimelate epimerase
VAKLPVACGNGHRVLHWVLYSALLKNRGFEIDSKWNVYRKMWVILQCD